MAVVLAISSIWLIRRDFVSSTLIVPGFLARLSGYWDARITHWRTYRKTVLSVPQGAKDRDSNKRLVNWMTFGLGVITYSFFVAGLRLALACFIVWWCGVFIDTVYESFGQARFEKYLISLSPDRRAAAMEGVRVYSASDGFSERRVYPMILTIAKTASATTGARAKDNGSPLGTYSSGESGRN